MTKWQKWLNKNCERLDGKTIVLTGSTGDIGKEIAKHILFLGGNLILAVRNIQKAEQQKIELLKIYPNAEIKILELDMAITSSIENFVKKIIEQKISPNHLICNAGILTSPQNFTSEGNEIHYATNFWGNILLGLKILPLLNQHKGSKIVFQSSFSSKFKKINWNDIESKNIKSKTIKYARSKRLLHLGAKMLSSYAKKHYPNVSMVMTHPGLVASKMTTKGWTKFIDPIANFVLHRICHKAATGALGAVYALFAKENEYIVPSGLFQIWGKPKKGKLPKSIYREKDLEKFKEIFDFDFIK